MKNKLLFFFCKLHILTAIFTLVHGNISAQAKDNVSLIKKVVIDAGHGGYDPGTTYKGINEKDITLAVALKLGKLIQQQHPSIEIIYTRTKDVFVELSERSRIANKHNANLFISIHVNSVKKGNASGSETYVMGIDKSDANLAVAQRENSVIMYEADFSAKYQGYDPNSPESFIIFSLLQNTHLDQSLKLASLVQQEFGNFPIKINRGVKQERFLVLWHAAMPSILVELGFLSSENDRKKLTSSDSQDQLAQALLRAFNSYKTSYELSTTAIPTNNTSSKTVYPSSSNTSSTKQQANNSAKSGKYYRVQVMSLNSKEALKSVKFKGYSDVDVIKVGKLYKYTIGNTQDLNEANKLCNQLQKPFKGAFVIAVENGKIVSVNN